MTDSLGIWLRRSREARKQDLEDVVRALRIRRRYLQALEMGDYEALPGPIQARGFLRNYARFLGLPVEDVLARYDAEVRGVPVQPRVPEIEMPSSRGMRNWAPAPPSVEEERIAVRANSSGSMLKVLGIALLLFALFTLVIFLWLEFGQGTVIEAAVATQPAVAASPTLTATPETPRSFVVSPDGTVRVRLLPLGHAWISVSADERIVFQGIAGPEQALEAVAGEMIIVSTGNGGAFRLFVNGEDWGVLGEQGQVVRKAWTPAGETPLGDS
jgi:transcriptional regulator with XRE-family HTH domain